jgi:hypothetical protein
MDVKKILLDCIDLEKLAAELIELGLEPALKKVVADSSNLVDDAVFAMVFPPLKLELHKFIAAEVAKLKA